jgi:hypothetical protein
MNVYIFTKLELYICMHIIQNATSWILVYERNMIIIMQHFGTYSTFILRKKNRIHLPTEKFVVLPVHLY